MWITEYLRALNKALKNWWIVKWSENDEQVKVIKYLEQNKYKFTSVPNSTFTKSIKQKIMNYLTWLRPWMSDIIIMLKTKPAILFLEMKKTKGKQWGMNWSVISDDQLSWQKEINKVWNCQYTIAHWYDEAIKEIESLEVI